jgi:hypothetical protein
LVLAAKSSSERPASLRALAIKDPSDIVTGP